MMDMLSSDVFRLFKFEKPQEGVRVVPLTNFVSTMSNEVMQSLAEMPSLTSLSLANTPQKFCVKQANFCSCGKSALIYILVPFFLLEMFHL